MPSAAITFTTDTHRATLTPEDGRVEISTCEAGHGWVFAGAGRWVDGVIDDCPAVLGDEVYARLEAGLADAIEREVSDMLAAEGYVELELDAPRLLLAPKRPKIYPFAGRPVDPSLARLTLEEIEQAMIVAGELAGETATWNRGRRGRPRRSQQFRGGRRRALIRLLRRTRGLSLAWRQWGEYLSHRTEVSPRLLDAVTMAADGIGESEDARGPRQLFPLLLEQIQRCWSFTA